MLRAPHDYLTGKSGKPLSSADRKNLSLYALIEAVIERAGPASNEGRFAIVTNAGWDAVDADVLLTNSMRCGRRSRVVLTPRRRRQVGGSNSAGDGDKKARSPGKSRRKPLKPLRGECRAAPVNLW